jgi:hypothetical protein
MFIYNILSSMDVPTIDRKIAAIKNSTEYRRLITSHRGPRDDQELSKHNIHISTLENKKAQLQACQAKPINPRRPDALGKPAPPKQGVPPKFANRVVTPIGNPTLARPVAVHKVKTFLPNRPPGLKAPARPKGKAAAANVPAIDAAHVAPAPAVPVEHVPAVHVAEAPAPAVSAPAKSKRPVGMAVKSKAKAKPKDIAKELDNIEEL